jgi:hypothetical protein
MFLPGWTLLSLGAAELYVPVSKQKETALPSLAVQ